MPTPRQAYELIHKERERQDAKWGGPDHDDIHVGQDWVRFICEHTAKALDPNVTLSEHKQHLIEVAALGCAAAEALDRAKDEIEDLRKEADDLRAQQKAR